MTAKYKTESFRLPIYYSIRLATSKDHRGWELEMIHLKICLQNTPPEIQQFQISHGFNMVLCNRTWQPGRLILRAGAGVVAAHPENTVRGLKLPEDSFRGTGYCIAGPCLQVSVEKHIPMLRGLYLSLEAKTTAAYARVGVSNGHAVAPHAGIHGLAGIGYELNR